MIVTDRNFVTEYGDDFIKTTAKATGETAVVKVGERTFMGWILTAKDLAEMKARVAK